MTRGRSAPTVSASEVRDNARKTGTDGLGIFRGPPGIRGQEMEETVLFSHDSEVFTPAARINTGGLWRGLSAEQPKAHRPLEGLSMK